MMNHWVTGADISPDGTILALLSHDRIWFVAAFNNRKFSSGKLYEVDLGSFTHKTGICFVSDSELYLIDERELGILGGKIYSLDLVPVWNALGGRNADVPSKRPNE